MARQVFWHNGNGKKSGNIHPWRGSGGVWGVPPFEEATSTPGVGVGGLGGHPPFEEVTSTPGMAVGGFGGSPPIRRGDIHPWHGRGGVWGVTPHSKRRHPPLAWEWGDNLAPFSSNKIRAKILDLGYGGARRALYNLSPKSARILSAAITIDWWTGAWSDDFAPRRG